MEAIRKKLKDFLEGITSLPGKVISGIQESLQKWAIEHPRKAEALSTWYPVFHPIETAKASLESQKITSIPQFLGKVFEKFPERFSGYIQEVSRKAYTPLFGETIASYVGGVAGGMGRQVAKLPATFFQKKPFIEHAGDIISGVTAIRYPVVVLASTLPMLAFKTGKTLLTQRRLPTKKELVSSIPEAIDFSAKFLPLSAGAGTLLKPITGNIIGGRALGNINSWIRIYRNAPPAVKGTVLKEAIGRFGREAFSKALEGAAGLGAFEALQPAKTQEERLKKTFEGATTGAIFGAGTYGLGQASRFTLPRVGGLVKQAVSEGKIPFSTTTKPVIKLKPEETKAFQETVNKVKRLFEAKTQEETPQLKTSANVFEKAPEIKIKTQETSKIPSALPETPFSPKSSPPSMPPISQAKQPPSLSDEDLIKRLTKAIKEAKPIRGLQETLYTKARGEKLGRLLEVREKMAGEKGFYEELAALKGELPKVKYEPVRGQFTQENVDRLFNMIKQTPKLDEWDKINAQVGLAKLLGEKGLGVPTEGELEKLYRVFGKEFTEAVLSKRSFFQKLTDAGMQLYNLPRSFMTGIGDLSAVFTHNLMFTYRHPVLTAKNLGEAVKMFANEKFFQASQEEIARRANAEFYKKMGLSLTDVSPIVRQREEAFMASWAEKIPLLGKVVRATGRAWTGFLNRMRADVADQLIATQKAVGADPNDPEFLKWAGILINAATGRGSLGAFERAAPILSQGFFSARKLAAAIQMMNPQLYISSPPVVRKEALKTVLSFLAGGATIAGLAKMLGAEVGTDPTSTDFGKIKIGNTRFNVWGTNQQIAVLFARLFKGYITSSTTGKKTYLGEGYKPLTRLDIISRFFETKEHPTLSLILGAIRGTDWRGQPFNLSAEVIDRFIPMVFADAYSLYKEHGAKGLLGIIPVILGVPTQTYGREIPVLKTNDAGEPKIELKPVPNLGEAIVNKITGQPVSNIPEPQQEKILEVKLKERQKEIDREEVKREAKKNKLKTKGDFIPVVVDDKIKIIDLSFQPKLPEMTGFEAIDKANISKFKKDINKKAMDIYDLYRAGYLTEDETKELLSKLEELQNKVSTEKTKIKIKEVKTPKVKILNKPKVKPLKIEIPPPITLKSMEKPKTPVRKTQDLVKLIRSRGLIY